MENLKIKTLRGSVAKLCGQAANFALRLGYLVVVTRLLSPQDFGLVAMVTVASMICLPLPASRPRLLAHS
jgi:PST family polysaccharide transporter